MTPFRRCSSPKVFSTRASLITRFEPLMLINPSRMVLVPGTGGDRTQERFGLWPARLAADSAYGSADNLVWLGHARGIEPHIPVFDKSQRSDGTFSRSDFAFDHARDLYTARAGRSCINTAGASVSAARASIPKASCATAPESRTAKPAL